MNTSAAKSTNLINFEIQDGVGRIGLNLNDTNSFDLNGLRALDQVLEQAMESQLWALIITSDRAGTFSHGLDLTAVSTQATDREQSGSDDNTASTSGIKNTADLGVNGNRQPEIPEFARLFFKNLRRLYTFTAPTVCAVGGHALGYGCMLALACDFRILADHNFRIGLPEAKVGLRVPEFIIQLMSQAIGPVGAKQHVMTGAAFKSSEALKLGFAQRVHSQADLEQAATSLAAKWKSLSAQSVRAAKQATLIDASVLEAMLTKDLIATAEFIGQADAQRGLAAVLQGRRPVFALPA